MLRLSKTKVKEFFRRYNVGETVTIYCDGMVNTFHVNEGFIFKVHKTDLLVYYPDGDFFDKYDMTSAMIYIKD